MTIGNAWLSTPQYILDAYRERNQIEQAGGEYNYPEDGIMDDESYRIITETKADALAIERQYNIVTVGPAQPYKLFSMWQDGTIQVKQDIDYLLATWTDMRALGSWWYDTGIQGGMQQPVDEDGNPDGPPTGTPFYPIPNNAYRFMPDIVEYDENGNEISRTPATSNADLRDVNLLLGQVPRDFTQYP